MDPKVALAERVRRLREGRGLTQEEFGRQVGVSQRVVSTWEVCRTRIPADEVPKLAQFFGLRICDLYGVEEAHSAPAEPTPLDRFTRNAVAEYGQMSYEDQVALEAIIRAFVATRDRQGGYRT